MRPLLEALESRCLLSVAPTVIMPPFGPGATVQTAHGHYADNNPDFRQPGYVSLASVLYTPEAGANLSPDQRDIYENQWYVPVCQPMSDAVASMIGPDTVVYGYPIRQTLNVKQGLPRDTPPPVGAAPDGGEIDAAFVLIGQQKNGGASWG